MELRDIELPKCILRRKFRQPKVSDSYLPSEKTRLLVAKPLSWRTCLLTSPTGYGKTAVLNYWCDCLKKSPRVKPLWISLDDSDRDQDLLVKGMAYAFCSVHPEFREVVESEDLQDKVLLVELCNHVDKYCESDNIYVIFLDNYDAVATDSFDNVLLFLNDNTDDNIKFVVAGTFRSRRLDDLLLSSSVIEVTQADFEMNEDELFDYVRTLMPQLTDDEVSRMREAFGSWPLPYSFAALAVNRCDDAAQAESTLDAYLERHFISTVVDPIDPAVLDFMIETAILETMPPALCDYIRNSSDSLDMLRHISSRGLYCYYDRSSREYAYEPSLRRFLLKRLLAQNPLILGSLARKAMAWCQDRGLDRLYAKYAVVINDPFYLSNIIELCTGRTLANPEKLVEFFLLTPAEEFSADPLLIWAVAWGLIAIGSVERANEWMALIPEDDAKGQMARRYAQAIGRALEGNPNESRDIIRSIFDTEGNRLSRELQCLLIHMEGEDCERLGDPRQGRELYHKALSLSRRTGTFYRLFDFYLLAHQHFLLGDFEVACKYADLGIRECTEDMPILGEFNAIIAGCFVERGELEEACSYLDCAFKKAAPQSNADMYLDINMCAARLQRALGNNSEALQILSDALSDVRCIRVPRNMDISAHALRLNLAIDLNETTPLLESREIIEGFGADCDVLRSAPAMLALARLYLHEGDAEKAAEAIERCKQLCQLAGSRYFNVVLLVLESACFSSLGCSDRALLLMTQALEIAAKGGYVMAFAEGGGYARDALLRIAARQKASTALRTHANKILARLHPGSIRNNSGVFLDESTVNDDLTARESEILELLMKGMTRFEIASYLQLSQNTVKSHLKNIYSKLGAHSREDVFRIYQKMNAK